MKSNVAHRRFVRPTSQTLRLAANAPESPKYQVPHLGVRHHKPPQYLGKTLLRATTIADYLWGRGFRGMYATSQDRLLLRNLIWNAMDDARSAGFSAGCAWARSR